MRAAVIVESSFGNTHAVAEGVAEGLRDAGAGVQLVTAAEAPGRVDADLVIVAAPTHNAGLPKPKSRAQAVDKGATSSATEGVREWITRIDAVPGRVVTITTTTGGKWDGSAAKAAVKALRKKKIKAEQGEDFLVTGTPGPLADGELERARVWAKGLIP